MTTSVVLIDKVWTTISRHHYNFNQFLDFELLIFTPARAQWSEINWCCLRGLRVGQFMLGVSLSSSWSSWSTITRRKFRVHESPHSGKYRIKQDCWAYWENLRESKHTSPTHLANNPRFFGPNFTHTCTSVQVCTWTTAGKYSIGGGNRLKCSVFFLKKNCIDGFTSPYLEIFPFLVGAAIQ